MYTCVQTMYKKRCEWRSGGVSGGVRGRSGGVRGTQVMYMYVQTVCTIKKRSEGEEWRSEGKEWRSEGTQVMYMYVQTVVLNELTVMSWPLMWAVRPWGPATEENRPLSACRPAIFTAWASGRK